MTNQNYTNYSARLRTTTARAVLCIGVLATHAPALGQTAESVGDRAQGMAGAFVAVASDSSAVWWNPAGLADGPFLDLSLTRAALQASERLPVWRQRITGFSITTPPVGISYYRFRITDIRPPDPTARPDFGREEGRAEVPVRSLAASQLGLTLVQTLFPGVHAGATFKVVRGTFREGREDILMNPAELLDRGDDLDGGDAESRFDLDVGLLAVTGPFRVGARVRNVREPQFGTARLPRQARFGVAFAPERLTGVPLTVALDWDVRTYAAASGPRRVVALGAEHWFWDKRLGARAGARVNTAGAEERAATAGASVAVRPGVYLEGHVIRGGAADERGWGLGARVSY